MVDRMSEPRTEIEAFIRSLVAEIEAAETAGITRPQEIANYLNGKGITSRKGRRWSAEAVAKFLDSPGARRYRMDGKAGKSKQDRA
jgi:hypothetical protein